MTDPTPLDYLGAHLEEALATDGRVAEQGLHVAVDGAELVVRGTVSTRQRCDAIAAVARETVPEARVRNEAVVAALGDHSGPEEVR
jgi:hypothetical protein